jgi:hypothetical protein
MDVVDRLGQSPVEGDRPTSRVEMRKVTIRLAAVEASPTPAP